MRPCICRIIFLIVVILVMSSVGTLSNAKNLCRDDERDALIQFNESLSVDKSSLSGPSAQPKTASWDQRDCCLWDGVECDNISGHIIGLDLSGCNLYGSINSSSTLFRLVHLQHLNLADNDFNQSAIPSQIGLFQGLTLLNLSSSQFSGRIPSEITTLTKLQTLDLSQKPGGSSLKAGLELQAIDFQRLFKNMSSLVALWLRLVKLTSSFPDVLELPSLAYLNLYGCGISGSIPSSFGGLTSLRRVNLGNNNFSGPIPNSLAGLKNLNSLSLFNNYLSGPIPSSLGDLTELTYLHIGTNNLSGEIPLDLFNLIQLEVLSLANNQLTGQIPSKLSNLAKLVQLDLGSNQLLGSIPSSFVGLTSLRRVNLGNNNFSGPIPNSLSGLKNLNFMSLGYNYLSGPIPSSLGDLTELTYLHIGTNNLSGEIPLDLFNLTQLQVLSLSNNQITGQIPSKLSNLAKIVQLDLGNNQLLGSIPSLINLTQLQTLFLSKNQLTGPIPSWLSNLTQLISLDVGSNQLQGSIPDSIFELQNLNTLYLGPNLLTGTLRFEMFTSLRNLQELQLVGSNLTVLTESNSNTSLLPKFQMLSMKFCNLEVIPSFLRYQDELYYLILQGNNIPGNIPKWLGDISRDTLELLDLRQNLLIGFEQSSMFSSFTNLQVVDLSNNKIQGQLPILPPSISYFVAFNNCLSGEIPPSFCGSLSLFLLNLELNNLSGPIPPCLGNLSDLKVLDLANNLFREDIPGTLSNLTSLTFIDLSGNQLDGLLPSLVGCQMLETVDLSNNYIAGNFPYWSGDLPNLEVLFLRSNQFSGEIGGPINESWFSKLRILDLSYNNFTGTLPSDLFLSLNRMKYIPPGQVAYLTVKENQRLTPGQIETDFDSRMILANKGTYVTYWKISNVVAALDLSSNRFQGGIPVSLGNMKMLIVLNLSHNHLSGSIPPDVGYLSNLESLDLSANFLSGEIPSQLGQLTFLEYFNVSHNHLVGPIPQASQLRTFDNSSYDGNLELCGEPLSKKCQDSESSPQPEPEGDEGSSISLDWKTVLVGYGCGLVLGLVIGFWFITKEQLMRLYRIRPKRASKRTRRRRT